MSDPSTKTDITQTGGNAACALEYVDLRDWLAEVERRGDLKIVTGASWEKDIGQVVEVLCHDEGTPTGRTTQVMPSTSKTKLKPTMTRARRRAWNRGESRIGSHLGSMSSMTMLKGCSDRAARCSSRSRVSSR